jgi:ACT domain-containing protein
LFGLIAVDGKKILIKTIDGNCNLATRNIRSCCRITATVEEKKKYEEVNWLHELAKRKILLFVVSFSGRKM